ncbi:hypothetical protein BDZ89DRAFT_1152713 [Hymenopellis radicata]|nr:hypothetical protein BDZ89DRAFT_1152713 [Hymenopellis radicata]
MLVQIHALARPIASIVSSEACPEYPSAEADYSHMLFMSFGCPFESRHLGEKLANASAKVLGWEMGINAHRHIFIAFHRKQHPLLAQEEENPDFDSISALQSGHSRSTENRVYGLSATVMEGAEEDYMAVFLEVSVAWQRTLRIVPAGVRLGAPESKCTEWDNLVRTGVIVLPPSMASSAGGFDVSPLVQEMFEHQRKTTSTTHHQLSNVLMQLEEQSQRIRVLGEAVSRLSTQLQVMEGSSPLVLRSQSADCRVMVSTGNASQKEGCAGGQQPAEMSAFSGISEDACGDVMLEEPSALCRTERMMRCNGFA